MKMDHAVKNKGDIVISVVTTMIILCLLYKGIYTLWETKHTHVFQENNTPKHAK